MDITKIRRMAQAEREAMVIRLLTDAGGSLSRVDMRIGVRESLGISEPTLQALIGRMGREGKIVSHMPKGNRRRTVIYLPELAAKKGIFSTMTKSRESKRIATVALNGDTGLSHNLYAIHPEVTARPKKKDAFVPGRLQRKIPSLLNY